MVQNVGFAHRQSPAVERSQLAQYLDNMERVAIAQLRGFHEAKNPRFESC